MDALTLISPAIPVLVLSVLVLFISRRAGHIAAIASMVGVFIWALMLGSRGGDYMEMVFLGFDVVFFSVDDFSVLMAVIFSGFGAAGFLYSMYSGVDRVQLGFALSYVGSSLGAVFSGDWLSLVFFWELMAMTSTLLVWHHGGRAVRAGYRYALLHGIGGGFLMMAALLHFVETGGGSGALYITDSGISSGLPAWLAMIGIGVNVGFVGLHAWIPDTYPTPHFAASVFLCVYTTKTGVYAMYRAFPDGSMVVAYMGGAMVVYGVVYALHQKDMRRLLSYHIQSQVGYMIAGVGMGGSLAVAGGMAHVFNHILYKGLLFMAAGAVIYRTGENNLKDLGGLWRAMPVTFIAFTVAALSISGFPGFNGFVSKGMVVDAAHQLDNLILFMDEDLLWWLLIIGAVGTFMSFIKFGYYAFLGDLDADIDIVDANLGQSAAMLSVAAVCVLLGLYPYALFELLPFQGEWVTEPYTAKHVAEGVVLGLLGLIGFRLALPYLTGVKRGVDVDRFYNPAVFRGTHWFVVGVTGLFHWIDVGAVYAADRSIDFMQSPADEISSVAPGRIRDVYSERLETHPGETGFRLGVGASILVITLILFLFLVVLL